MLAAIHRGKRVVVALLPQAVAARICRNVWSKNDAILSEIDQMKFDCSRFRV
jgi:hypothetical protein